MSAFAVGDRVRFWGGARPEGLPGVVVALDVAGSWRRSRRCPARRWRLRVRVKIPTSGPWTLVADAGSTTPRRPQLIAWALATGVALDWLESGRVRPKGFEPPTFWSVLWEHVAWSVARFATRSTLDADDLALAA